MKRRYKRILISDVVLLDFMKHCVADKKDIPEDAEAVGVYYDYTRQSFDVRLYSEEYPELPEGGVIEIIQPVFARAFTEQP